MKDRIQHGHPAPTRGDDESSSTCRLRERAAEYVRLAGLAKDPVVAEQLRVFGESYAAVAARRGNPPRH